MLSLIVNWLSLPPDKVAHDQPSVSCRGYATYQCPVE